MENTSTYRPVRGDMKAMRSGTVPATTTTLVERDVLLMNNANGIAIRRGRIASGH
jgi:hypothetical protein